MLTDPETPGRGIKSRLDYVSMNINPFFDFCSQFRVTFKMLFSVNCDINPFCEYVITKEYPHQGVDADINQ